MSLSSSTRNLSVCCAPPYRLRTSDRFAPRPCELRTSSWIEAKRASTRATFRSAACLERLQLACVMARFASSSLPPADRGSIWSISSESRWISRSMGCSHIKQVPSCVSCSRATSSRRSSGPRRLRKSEDTRWIIYTNRFGVAYAVVDNSCSHDKHLAAAARIRTDALTLSRLGPFQDRHLRDRRSSLGDG